MLPNPTYIPPEYMGSGPYDHATRRPPEDDTSGDPFRRPPAPDPTTPTTPTTPSTTSPWWTAPTDGNWQAWFTKNWGKPRITPAELKALEPDLAKAGVKVLTNGAGVSGKIQLPDGTIVDIIRAAGDPNHAQHGTLQWMTGSGTTGGSTKPITVDPSYLAPWTREFSYADFVKPTAEDVYADPSYQFRFGEGMNALENSAAAKGLLNSGGTLQDLARWGQAFASNEYGNVWNRNFDLWARNYDNAYRDFLGDRDAFWTNQNNAWGKLRDAATIGGNAAQA